MLYRSLFAVAALLSLALSSGCRMCQSPYDYCGPTFHEGCGSCDPYERQGSVLDGNMVASSDVIYDDGTMMGPTPADRRPAYNRGEYETMPDRIQPSNDYDDPRMDEMLPSAVRERARPLRR